MKLKRLQISPEFFFQLLTAGYHPPRGYRVDKDAIPGDAKLVNVRLGWPNQIELLIESESFPEVNSGDEIPGFSPQIWTDYPEPEGMDAS